MKHRLQDRFQVPLDHHLGDPIGDRRNPERSGSSRIAFRYVNATHGRRKVASRRHSIPDPIEVLTEILIEVLDRLAIHSSRPSVGLHLLVRFPHIELGNTKRLCSIHGASFAGFGRRADRSACHCAVVARYSRPPLRVAALRRNSREIVDAFRSSRRATSRTEQPCTRRSAISSRSANER